MWSAVSTADQTMRVKALVSLYGRFTVIVLTLHSPVLPMGGLQLHLSK